MIQILTGILFGALNGAIVALLGYAKNSTAESFEPKKALQTIIVGAIVGGFAGYYGWTYEQAYEWAGSMGIITIAEYGKKTFIRLLSRYFTHEKESS